VGEGNISLPRNPHPLTEHQKIVASDHVGNPYGCAKFGANLSTGGLLGEWVKYDEILFIYLFIPFFRQLTYRSDPSTDFHA